MIERINQQAKEAKDYSEEKEKEESRFTGPKPLSVGNYFINNFNDFTRHKNRLKAFVLAVSEPDCKECYEVEDMLDKFFKLNLMEEIQYKGRAISLVRIDTSKHVDILHKAKIPFQKSPQLYVYFKEKFYPYEKGNDLNLFIHFVNKHFYPVVILDSIEKVEEFADTSKEFIENTPTYRNMYR